MRPLVRRALLSLTAAAAAALLAWTLGLAWFIHRATEAAAPLSHADGIVALTGGADRVETALRLLLAGQAGRLLISGAGAGAELGEFAHLAGVDPGPLAGRVTLGRHATSTHGNAIETAAWVRDNGIRSLIVVTAGYHMPRALTELSRTLTGVTLLPAPVLPPALRGPGLRDPATLRLMAEEYTKWLAAQLGLSSLPGPLLGARHAA